MIQGWFNALMASGGGGTDVFLWIGDSIIAGYNNTEGAGTSPVAGTTFQCDGTTITPVTLDSDFASVASGQGSAIGQFCNDYYNNTGNNIIIVPRGFSGSDFVFENNADHWGSGGNLYTPAKTAANNTLTLASKTSLKAIVISLGTNDASGSTAIATVETGIDALFDNLVTDFPNTPILFIQPGAIVSITQANLIRRNRICARILSNVSRLTNFHVIDQLYPYVTASLISADAVHPSKNGMNMMGSKVARWFTLSSFSNKYTRGLLTSFFDDIGSASKSAINTFIEAEVANGNYPSRYENLFFLKNETERNTYVDWSLRSNFLVNSGAQFLTDDCLNLRGSPEHFRINFAPSVNTASGLSFNDIIIGVDITENNDVGTVGRAIGWTNSVNSGFTLTQGASNVTYQEWDVTATVRPTDTAIGTKFYFLRRASSTGKNIDEDGANVGSASVTAVDPGTGTHNMAFGALNSPTGQTQHLKLKIRCAFVGKGSTFNVSGFFTNYTQLDTDF